jgi:hypothetical protein
MQNSIDWLFKKLWDEPKDKFIWYALLEQAKEMHKQEIINSYQQGTMDGYEPNYGDGSLYYQETFTNK